MKVICYLNLVGHEVMNKTLYLSFLEMDSLFHSDYKLSLLKLKINKCSKFKPNGGVFFYLNPLPSLVDIFYGWPLIYSIYSLILDEMPRNVHQKMPQDSRNNVTSYNVRGENPILAIMIA